MTLYDSDTVTLMRDIWEDAWEGLTFSQRTQTPKSEIALHILRLAQSHRIALSSLRESQNGRAISDFGV